MVAMGLVPDLTAKQPSSRPGSRCEVSQVFSYRLTDREVHQLEEIDRTCSSCGGTDGGNSEVILHNAKRLVQARCPRAHTWLPEQGSGDEIEEMLTRAGRRVYVAENVMRRFES